METVGGARERGYWLVYNGRFRGRGHMRSERDLGTVQAERVQEEVDIPEAEPALLLTLEADALRRGGDVLEHDRAQAGDEYRLLRVVRAARERGEELPHGLVDHVRVRHGREADAGEHAQAHGREEDLQMWPEELEQVAVEHAPTTARDVNGAYIMCLGRVTYQLCSSSAVGVSSASVPFATFCNITSALLRNKVRSAMPGCRVVSTIMNWRWLCKYAPLYAPQQSRCCSPEADQTAQ